MRVVKGVIALLSAVLLVGHAAAQNGIPKVYSAGFTAPATIPAPPAPAAVTLTVRNEAPPGSGSSNISSLLASVDGLTIIGFQQPSTGLVSFTPTTISVTSMGPLHGGDTYTLVVYVASCGDARWDTHAFTGSQLNGQEFDRINDASPVPANLITNISCGQLGCAPNSPEVVVPFILPDGTQLTNTEDARYMTIQRAAYDKTGVCSTSSATSYFVTNLLASLDPLHVRWSLAAQPSAVFAYRVNIPGGPSAPPSFDVAWMETVLTDGTIVPSPIPAPTCVADVLPAPYGALSANVSAADNALTVNTAIAGALSTPKQKDLPLPIFVDHEWMLVTKIQGGTWQVTRYPTMRTTHTASALLMRTAMPLLVNPPAPYANQMPAQMCAVQNPVFNGTDSNTWKVRVHDGGDGWIVPN